MKTLRNKASPKALCFLVVSIMVLFTSCNPSGEIPDVESTNTSQPITTTPAIPSQTPFSPEQASLTPGILKLWLAPSLPESLKAPLLTLKQAGGRPVEYVEEAELAEVRVEHEAEVPLARWIFVLVAPFPTLTDDVPMNEFLAAWRGEALEFTHFYIAQENAVTIEALLGDLPQSVILSSDPSELLEQAWEDEAALALIPFEALEPRWKVLALDGSSPIHKDFDPETYPLNLGFGLSGDPKGIEALLDEIEWPVTNRDPQRLTVLTMTGVTALTRATAWTMELKGIEYPAEKILYWLEASDFLHVSNEVSFLDTCPSPKPTREGLIFCSDPDYVALLEAIDVDLIELTGNHLKDYGEEGLLSTLEMYRERGWEYFGGGENLEDSLQPVLIEHNGNKIALLGCNSAGPSSVWASESSPGATPCDEETLYAEVQRLRSDGYLTVFTFQWNEYYRAQPSPEQVEDFHSAIDAGAVIVSGSQAHQPQAFEFYDGGFIHYGLGNLFFDQMWAIQVRQEFIDRYIFYDGKHISTELLTAVLEDYAQPRPMTSEERSAFLREIFTASGW
jgi:hypothetical protein